eukprot:snap_masked-scaffold_8-processed-gene-13.18-mRNA-1 protein AED:1.00 eAED:1.00 QI:0/-1/0/0/-1/1/1/0/391
MKTRFIPEEITKGDYYALYLGPHITTAVVFLAALLITVGRADPLYTINFNECQLGVVSFLSGTHIGTETDDCRNFFPTLGRSEETTFMNPLVAPHRYNFHEITFPLNDKVSNSLFTFNTTFQEKIESSKLKNTLQFQTCNQYVSILLTAFDTFSFTIVDSFSDQEQLSQTTRSGIFNQHFQSFLRSSSNLSSLNISLFLTAQSLQLGFSRNLELAVNSSEEIYLEEVLILCNKLEEHYRQLVSYKELGKINLVLLVLVSFPFGILVGVKIIEVFLERCSPCPSSRAHLWFGVILIGLRNWTWYEYATYYIDGSWNTLDKELDLIFTYKSGTERPGKFLLFMFYASTIMVLLGIIYAEAAALCWVMRKSVVPLDTTFDLASKFFLHSRLKMD